MIMLSHEWKCYLMDENIYDFFLRGIIGRYIHGQVRNLLNSVYSEDVFWCRVLIVQKILGSQHSVACVNSRLWYQNINNLWRSRINGCITDYINWPRHYKKCIVLLNWFSIPINPFAYISWYPSTSSSNPYILH